MKRVLIGARDFGHGGGVVGVVQALNPHLNQVDVGHFRLGRDPAGSMWDGFSVSRDQIRLHRLKPEWDLLHLNTSLRPRAVFRDGILLANWGPRPSVVTFHGWSDALWRRLRSVGALRRWFVAAYGGRRVIALAECFREGLIDLGLSAEDISVIGPAYDGSRVHQRGRAAQGRIVYLGRLEPEKGIFEVLRGFEGLDASAELVLVGSGSAEPAIRAWVDARGLTRRVRLTGRLEGEDKIRTLQSASVFVLASHSEGLPVAMLEAMAVGLPVVVSDVGGVSEVVVAGEHGWLLQKPSEVGDALGEALADPELCRAMGKRNRLRARDFEASVIARQVQTAYLEALEAKA
jgi:glycosyltransferase involved in cell wall biosynthesis